MKRRTIILISVAIVLASAILGAILSVSFFAFIGLLIVAAITFGVTTLVLIVDFFAKSKFAIFPSAVFGFVLLAILSASIFKSIKNTKKENVAKEIVSEFNSYKEKNGMYPSSLAEIHSKDLFFDLGYWTDSVQQQFRIIYDLDGWHTQNYTSETERWFVED